MTAHAITKAIVTGAGGSVLRAKCSCGEFSADAARLSTAARRRQDRLIREHLGSVSAAHDLAALLVDNAIGCAP